jgi:hypothetical protein
VNGEPPSPQHHAAHNCGNASCVNPYHIRWATPSENQADRVEHGTSNRGERNGQTALTEDQVREIRALDRVISDDEISMRYGVSKSSILNILHGKTWGWLDADKWQPKRAGDHRKVWMVTLDGVTLPLKQACAKYSVPYNKAKCRLLRGWTAEEAFEFVRRPKYGARASLKSNSPVAHAREYLEGLIR